MRNTSSSDGTMLTCHFSGILGGCLDRAVRRLHAHPYSRTFVRSDVSFEIPRIFNAYSGDVSGRYIEFFSVYGQLGYATGDLDALVREVLSSQQPQGYFGVPGFDKTRLTDRETKIFWGNGRLLIGLLEYYRLTKDQSVLAAAKRMGEFLWDCGLHESTSAIGKAVAADAGAAGFATTFCSCIEGVVRLFVETGDQRYATLARGISALLPETFDGFHSHGRMTALRGMVDLAVATGDEAIMGRVLRQWQTIHDQHVTLLGGMRENFGYACTRDEGCSVADWLMLSLKLFAATGRADCLEAAELCLFNHLLANQFGNGGFGHKAFLLDRVNGHDDAVVAGVVPDGGKEAYWCCSLHGPRALLEAARHLVTGRASTEMVINYVAPAEVRGNGWHLSLAADGLGESLQITVHEAPAGVGEQTMRIRVPSWAHEPVLRIGQGKNIVPANGFLSVERPLKAGDVVHVDLHPRMEVRPGTDAAQRQFAADKDALYFGRLLLGYDCSDDLLWGQMMQADSTTVLLIEDQPQPAPAPARFPQKTIVEYFDRKQNRTIWAPRPLVPVIARRADQPLRTLHTIARRPWASLTTLQQTEIE